MINYNLREQEYKNHPLEYKWGFLIGSPIYQNHLCTVVDNHNEVINGRYTHETAKLLLHMSPNVRKYVEAKLFDEFLYVSVWNDKNIPTYTNWEYTYKELTQEEKDIEMKIIAREYERVKEFADLAENGMDVMSEFLEKWRSYTGG